MADDGQTQELTDERGMPSLRPGIGAVVIGRNEGGRLLNCLKSLKTCDAIVYVDSGSTDGSVVAATRLGADVVQLDLSLPFTAARARNAGFERISAICTNLDFVQFIDGDCELLPGWIEDALDFIRQRPDVAVVCGRRMERHPEASVFNAMCHREWNTPVGEAEACGGDALVRASAFQTVGGFVDEQIAHEEPELCARLRKAGFRIWRLDRQMTLHDAAIYRVGQFYRRNRRAGFGLAQCLASSSCGLDRNGKNILRRAFFWAVFLPLVTIAAIVFITPLAALGLLLYPAQIIRQAMRTDAEHRGAADRVKVAGLGMIGKFAEAHGSIEYAAKALAGAPMKAIFYK